MDFDSDDSTYDPNYNPCDDGSEEESSESDSASETWNLLAPQRRQFTFSYDMLPSLPNIQRRRTLRTQLAETRSSDANISSSSGTTSPEITEMTWLKRKLENIKWEMPSHEDPESIEYTVPFSGMKDIFSGILAHAKPLDYFELFLTRDILEEVVDQTNLYAAQQMLTTDATPSSRTHAWVPVTVDDMTKFLALIGWMGLVKLPSIKDYWRVQRLYGLPLARSVMPRNKFVLILKYIHFSDNSIEDADDRLKKVRNVIDKFISNYNKAYIPGDNICVDESLIPWHERLIFRQYIPNKAAKYGIKFFKLCTDKGYTWNLEVYCGKSKLFIEILWGTSLVNAHFLYNLNTSAKKMTITEFREQVIVDMIDKCSQRVDIAPIPSTSSSKRKAPMVKHYLIDNKVGEKLVRGRCKECYNMYGRKGKIINGKKVRAA